MEGSQDIDPCGKQENGQNTSGPKDCFLIFSFPPSMQQPPFLPEETLSRVLRLAKFDGMGALVLGGLFALTAAAGRHVPFTVIGLLAAGAGAVELHGEALLRQGEPRGMKWLIASQPFMFLVILTYCGLRLWLIEVPPVPEWLKAIVATSAAQAGLTLEGYMLMVNRLTALMVAVVALGFQGGMALYYWRRRKPVEQALAEGHNPEE